MPVKGNLSQEASSILMMHPPGLPPAENRNGGPAPTAMGPGFPGKGGLQGPGAVVKYGFVAPM